MACGAFAANSFTETYQEINYRKLRSPGKLPYRLHIDALHRLRKKFLHPLYIRLGYGRVPAIQQVEFDGHNVALSTGRNFVINFAHALRSVCQESSDNIFFLAHHQGV